MRPYKQYVAHGVLIASIVYIIPAAITMSVVEDWAKDKPWKDILKDNLIDIGESFFDSLDDITDMSYMDRGEAIEL
jgi:hypothetical protein